MAEESKGLDLLMRVGENGSKILEAFTKGGVAYLGYKSANHWSGALVALIALKLATGGNLAGGVAGTAVLTGMGLSQMTPEQREWSGDVLTAIGGISNPLMALETILQQVP